MSSSTLATSVFRQLPRVQQNAQAGAPMALVLAFDVSVPGTLELLAVGEGPPLVYRWPVEPGAQTLPVIGLKPARHYRFDVSLLDARGQRVAAEPQSVQTPALPLPSLDFPPLRVHRAERARMEPGLTLLSVRRRALGRSHRMTPEQRLAYHKDRLDRSIG
jgi:hypothetical protein